jgi:hypothetical protein
MWKGLLPSRLLMLLSLFLLISCNGNKLNNSDVSANNDTVSTKINTSDKKTESTKIKLISPKKINQVSVSGPANVSLSSGAHKSNRTDAYKLRKYDNVTNFYRLIAKPATRLCIEKNVPPAAILAIAGLESGWNRGYVGRITGNILSLGAVGDNYELPALYIPRVKSTDKLIFDSLEIIKYDSSELNWELRPPSLKKDYRPANIAGTSYQLAYFKYHPEEKAKAQISNINDFVTYFISPRSRIKVYRIARQKMDSLVAIYGKNVLLEESSALMFVNQIGGRPNSFNYRETWPKKLEYIIKNAGLIELTKQLNDNKEFYEVW